MRCTTTPETAADNAALIRDVSPEKTTRIRIVIPAISVTAPKARDNVPFTEPSSVLL